MRTLIVGAIFDAPSVQTLLLTIAGLVIVAIGLSTLLSAKKADYSQTAKTSVNTVVGIAFLALGTVGIGVVNFGHQILDALGIGK